MASSTIFGALFAKSALSTAQLEHILVNFAAGILVFIIVREALPQPKEGKTSLFVLGVIVYGILIYIENTLI